MSAYRETEEIELTTGSTSSVVISSFLLSVMEVEWDG